MKRSETNQFHFLFFLSKIKGLGTHQILELIKTYGRLEKIKLAAMADKAPTDKILGLIQKHLTDPNFIRQVEKEWSDIKDPLISILDTNYPSLLKSIYDPPLWLYWRGNKELLNSPYLLTMVGSRRTTSYHQQATRQIIGGLSGGPLIIVSGLAYGLDALCHRYALENNLATIAVLGSGLSDQDIYPQAHQKLAQEILNKGGLLLSEYPAGSPVLPYQFALRNRILAGLSRATVIVSGARKSGALITAQVALEEGREILALPGNINAELNWAPHSLIKNGALLLDSAEDILKIYKLKKTAGENNEVLLADELENKIYASLRLENLSAEQLAAKLDLPLQAIHSVLTRLELKNIIKTNIYNQIEII